MSLYKILDNPKIYNLAQFILSGERVHRELKKIIKKHLEYIPYANILDSGCGTGIFRECFSGQYNGFDINKKYIEEAQVRGSGNYVVSDACKMPYKDNKFDLVFNLGLFHHLGGENQKVLFNEMFRVCKKNGVIFIMDGLVSSNPIGYVLAKLDRGRYKLSYADFKKRINSYADNTDFSHYRIFPYEYAVCVIRKT